MNAPGLFSADQLRKWDVARENGGRWTPVRPLVYAGIRTRIKLAIGVFLGRYDALTWE